MRLAFMGSPAFALPTLEALARAGHEIAAVYCRAPKPAGRGQDLRPTPVEEAARRMGLKVLTPRTLKTPEAQAEFAALNLDAAVVAAYGLILPQAVLDAPRYGCLNVHPSLLPRWRGAAPLHRPIMAGDARTGVCVMRMTAGLDEGPVLKRLETPIGPDETTGELHDRLAAMGAGLMLEALEDVAAGRAPAEPQPEAGVLYAAKIDKAETRIDWSRSAAEIHNHIRGLSPFPGAWTEMNGERVKILRAAPEPGEGAPGTLLDDRLLVACGSGALRLTRLQRPGKGPMAAADLLRGFAVKAGERLG